MRTIPLHVYPSMALQPLYDIIGYDGDTNSVAFLITQPQELDAFNCRAEYENNGEKRFVEVINKSFTLPQAALGALLLQLVYVDPAGLVIKKTSAVSVTVGPSVNAVPPPAPGELDGITRIYNKAFCDAALDEAAGEIVFTNFNGYEAARVALPAGSGGPGDKRHTHGQDVPASVWLITHNLGKYPSATVIDSAGGTVGGAEIEYIDENALILRFAHEFSGSAYLN